MHFLLFRPATLQALVTVALLALSGCGANVVFGDDGTGDNPANGGNGGTGATGGSGLGPGPGGSTSTGILTPCEQFCAAGCFDPDCMSNCTSLYGQGCDVQLEALLLCYAGALQPDCSLSPSDACSQESAIYTSCSEPENCFTDGCSAFGGGGACDCVGECNGTPIEQNCFFGTPPPGDPPPPPSVTCDCFSNGTFFGECTQDALSCQIETGCCRQFLVEG